MHRKPINLKFNGMSQRQASAIADATIGTVVEDFRRAAAEAVAATVAVHEQDASDHLPFYMTELYDEDGEPRSPLSFLDDLPFGGGFDCYGGLFRI